MNKAQIEAELEVSVLVSKISCLRAHLIAREVHRLGVIARSLHRRYENMWNYAWASGDRYNADTDRLEARATAICKDLGVDNTFQRDPRGWPLILTFNGQDTTIVRLG